MGFAQEMKDFIAGYKTGTDINEKGLNRELKEKYYQQLKEQETRRYGLDVEKTGINRAATEAQTKVREDANRRANETAGREKEEWEAGAPERKWKRKVWEQDPSETGGPQPKPKPDKTSFNDTVGDDSIVGDVAVGGDDGVLPTEGNRPSSGRMDTQRALAAIERFESGGRNINQNIVPAGGGYNPSTGTRTGPSSASGHFQMIDPTWRSAAKMAGIDTSQYPRAINAPYELQRKAAAALYEKEGFKPWAPYNASLRAHIGGGGGSFRGGASGSFGGGGGGGGGGRAPSSDFGPPPDLDFGTTRPSFASSVISDMDQEEEEAEREELEARLLALEEKRRRGQFGVMAAEGGIVDEDDMAGAYADQMGGEATDEVSFDDSDLTDADEDDIEYYEDDEGTVRRRLREDMPAPAPTPSEPIEDTVVPEDDLSGAPEAPAAKPAAKPAKELPTEGKPKAGQIRKISEVKDEKTGDGTPMARVLDPKAAQQAMADGLKAVQAEYTAGGGIPTGDDPKVGTFARNGDIPSHEDMDQVRKLIDPDNKLAPHLKSLAMLNGIYMKYLSVGEPEKAAKMAGSMALYLRHTAQTYGTQIQAAVENKNTPAVAKLMEKGFEEFPNGQNVETKPNKDGSVDYKMYDVNGELTDAGRMNVDRIMELATGLQDGSVWMEETIGLATGRGHSRQRGGGGRAPSVGERREMKQAAQQQAVAEARQGQIDTKRGELRRNEPDLLPNAPDYKPASAAPAFVGVEGASPTGRVATDEAQGVIPDAAGTSVLGGGANRPMVMPDAALAEGTDTAARERLSAATRMATQTERSGGQRELERAVGNDAGLRAVDQAYQQATAPRRGERISTSDKGREADVTGLATGFNANLPKDRNGKVIEDVPVEYREKVNLIGSQLLKGNRGLTGEDAGRIVYNMMAKGIGMKSDGRVGIAGDTSNTGYYLDGNSVKTLQALEGTKPGKERAPVSVAQVGTQLRPREYTLPRGASGIAQPRPELKRSVVDQVLDSVLQTSPTPVSPAAESVAGTRGQELAAQRQEYEAREAAEGDRFAAAEADKSKPMPEDWRTQNLARTRGVDAEAAYRDRERKFYAARAAKEAEERRQAKASNRKGVVPDEDETDEEIARKTASARRGNNRYSKR